VILAARRALEINDGSPPLTPVDPKSKPAVVALREIAQNKVSLRLKKPGK
jgi:DNA-directed RNA polymerase omega subunit